MQRIKQSVSWWCYDRSGLRADQLVQAAAEIGYAAVELAGAEHWPLIRDHGLRIASIAAHRSIESGLNRRENHARIEAELLTSLDLAVKWDIPNLIVFSGNRVGLDDAEGARVTAEGLARIAPQAEQAGVNLVIELLNSKIDHADYQADRTAWGAQVVDRVASPRVLLLYDIYHMQIMEGDIIRTIRANHARIGHYHTAGNPGRHEIDATQELNYPGIVRAIIETGYSGYLGHEFIPTGDPIVAMRQAFALCDV